MYVVRLAKKEELRKIFVGLACYILIMHLTYNDERQRLGSLRGVIRQIYPIRSTAEKCLSSHSSNLNVTVVKPCGTFLDRINGFNSVIEGARRTMINGKIFRVPWRTISPKSDKKIIWGNRGDLFEQISGFPQVKSIWLEWESSSVKPWSSLEDRSNLLVQKYYPLTGSEPLCTWIETPGMTHQNYNRMFNRTCNRNVRTAVEPRSLDPIALNLDKFNDQNFLESGSMLPPFSTHLQIITNGLVSNLGEIFTDQFSLIPNGCFHMVSPLPTNANEMEMFDEVFVIAQTWGNNVFHEMVENVPRLALHLEFLKNHPHIPILSYGKKSGRLREIFRLLDLNESRIYNGWCRGKIVYLPRPTPCGSGNVQELQMLAWHFRNFMERNFEPDPRNRIVLIRRSHRRKFTQQAEIERVVKSAALRNNLTFTLFRDDPNPSLYHTMRLFKSALMVVGPHGAGLSNIIFSDPGTFVIEGVCNLPHLNMCYHRQAQVLGHRWHGIPSRGGCERVVDVDPAALDLVIREYLSHIWFQQSHSSRLN